MADDFENVGASYVPGTEEAYRELVKKADALRRGQMSEQQVEAAFDEIVGVDGDEFEGGFVPEARDEKIEDLFATLSEQARQMEKAAKVSTIHDFDNALDKMTRDPGQDDMADALAQLDSIKL